MGKKSPNVSIQKEFDMGGGYTVGLCIDTLVTDTEDANHRTVYVWIEKDGEPIDGHTLESITEVRGDEGVRLMIQGSM